MDIRIALSLLFCYIGLFFQVYYITIQFLRYDSVTQVVITRPDLVNPPTLAICIKKDDSLDVTAKELLQQRPGIGDFVSSLKIHSLVDYSIINTRGNFSSLIIRKFIKQFFICYSIRLKSDIMFDYNLLTNSYNDPSFYRLKIRNSIFDTYEYLYMFMYPSTMHMYGRSESFVEHSRGIFSNKTNAFSEDYFAITHQMYSILRLPPPYATNCVDYNLLGFESKKECYELCLTKLSILNFEKLPFTVLIKQPLNYKIMNSRDNANGTTLRMLDKLAKECKARCAYKSCLKIEYVPQIIATAENARITIDLYASNSPLIQSTYKPLINFIDYLTYILSCVSFWLGFSPLNFLTTKKKRRKKNDLNSRQLNRMQLNLINKRFLFIERQMMRLSNFL